MWDPLLENRLTVKGGLPAKPLGPMLENLGHERWHLHLAPQNATAFRVLAQLQGASATSGTLGVKRIQALGLRSVVQCELHPMHTNVGSLCHLCGASVTARAQEQGREQEYGGGSGGAGGVIRAVVHLSDCSLRQRCKLGQSCSAPNC